MAGTRCSTGEAVYKRLRAIKLRKNAPELTAEMLAMRLGVGVRTVKGWLSQAGASTRESAVTKRADALQLRADSPDMSASDIAELVGSTERTVREWLSSEAAGRNEAVAGLCPESL